MAITILRSNHHQKLFHVLGLFSLFLLIQKGGATEFKVGGSEGWRVDLHYNHWAEKNRFKIGDTLLFVYPGDKDAVLLVNKEDYTNCNTENYIEKFTDGHTVFGINESGPHYFISGVKENCLRNEKMVVVALADRSNVNGTSTLPPPPTAEEMPSPSGASSIVLSFIGSIGAFVGSSLLFDC